MSDSVRLDRGLPTITVSDQIFARARGLIPAGTQTLAKGPQQHVRGVAPKYLRRGKGARVWDVDGNEYIDLTMGVGPLILGYGYPAVDEAVRAQLEDGVVFSLMHPLEVEVAELIREVVPCAEMVRYSKSGADVCSAAIRVARAATGRSKVLCCGYHGWHDWYIAVTDRAAGIPPVTRELTYTFDYNDLEGLAASIDDQTACVILEPVTFQVPAAGYLQAIKDLCEKHGALLIFDEMWTGFRMAVGGAQEYFGVTPHLATFSKAVANGMPLGVLTGLARYMQVLENDVFFFTTFGGEALSLAAAKATIHELRTHDVPRAIARTGARLREGYNAIAAELDMPYTRCVGFDCRTMITFQPENQQSPLHMKTLLQQELLRHGVLWSGFHNVSFSHSEADAGHVLAAYKQALPILSDAVARGDVAARLKGEPIEPVFRRTSNFNTKPRT
jgi:glutamate-1-semialdehyde 2,1-aminomutase